MCYPWGYEFHEIGGNEQTFGPFPSRKVAGRERTYQLNRNVLCSLVRPVPLSGEEHRKLKDEYPRSRQKIGTKKGREKPVIASSYFSPKAVKRAVELENLKAGRK